MVSLNQTSRLPIREGTQVQCVASVSYLDMSGESSVLIQGYIQMMEIILVILGYIFVAILSYWAGFHDVLGCDEPMDGNDK